MATPNLADYDVILVNSSAGKDSQAMLDYVVELATAAGVRDRIVVVHADLGRSEWPGTGSLAAEQAAHYGLPFHVVRREKGDLLTQVEERGMWPDNKNRYCTSDQKRDQVAKLLTKLATDHLTYYPKSAYGPVRILNCLGLRADESAAREKCAKCKAKPAKMAACPTCKGTGKRVTVEVDARATNGRRTVTTWLPIHGWTVAQVWDRIKASGVRHHPAYDLGMPRLSCVFCIFAPKSALVLAGSHNPDLLDTYVAVEQKIGHTFRQDLSLASVRDAVRNGGAAVQVSQAEAANWCM